MVFFGLLFSCLSLDLFLAPFWYEKFMIDIKHQRSEPISNLLLSLTNSSNLTPQQQLCLEVLQNCIPKSGIVSIYYLLIQNFYIFLLSEPN